MSESTGLCVLISSLRTFEIFNEIHENSCVPYLINVITFPDIRAEGEGHPVGAQTHWCPAQRVRVPYGVFCKDIMKIFSAKDCRIHCNHGITVRKQRDNC